MYEARIYLGLSLLAYPRTTIAWVHLPSCVPSLLAASTVVRFVYPKADSP